MDELKRRLLNFYKELYENNPNKYKGACKASRKLKLSKEEYGYNYWKTHNLLQELERDGYLEQKKDYGFRYYEDKKPSELKTIKRNELNGEVEEAYKKLSLIIKKAEEIKEEALFLSEEITDLCGDILEILNKKLEN